MNTKPQQQFKKQRIRSNPIKKWNVYEEKLLIEYLLQYRNEIERPTARIFYKRFSDEKKVIIDWKLVRSKVRNMRISYFKTRSALEASAEEGEENRSIRKCNFYNELDMIFAHRYTKESAGFENMSSEDFNIQLDNDDTSTAASERSDIDILPTSTNRNGSLKISSPPTAHESDFVQIKSVGFFEDSFVSENQNESLVIQEKETKLEKGETETDILPTSSTSRREIFKISPTLKEDLMQIESVCSVEDNFMAENQNAVSDIKERELFIKEKEIELEERRLQLKEKKIISEENIKIHKINSREKLKIKEMEMKERLALEELKLKYK